MSEYKSCDNCHYTNHGMFEYPCRECTHNRAIDHWVSRNNADRIRNMTDEELAKVIGEDPHCQMTKCTFDNCYECTLQWLQAEVDGDK